LDSERALNLIIKTNVTKRRVAAKQYNLCLIFDWAKKTWQKFSDFHAYIFEGKNFRFRTMARVHNRRRSFDWQKNTNYGELQKIMKNQFRKVVTGRINSFSLKALSTFVFLAASLLTMTGAQAQTLDAGFNPNANGRVNELAIQADGKILVGGQFTSIGGQPRNDIARLNADGTLDTAFNPNASGGSFSFVLALAIQADGKIVVGGDFTSIGGQPRNRIARLNADGTADTAFNPNSNGIVNELAIQADGSILVGGNFTSIGGQPRIGIARLNADGTADTAFNPNASGGSFSGVFALAIQADGKILVGGIFTSIGGQPRNNIARLNADGTLDTAFNPNANGRVNELAIQADGKIVVGGLFTSIGGQTRNSIARLNADGTLDTAFNPNANEEVLALAIQADGKILVGGRFTSIGGQPRNNIARLNADGTADTAFNPNANNFVTALAIQSNGSILVGGDFTSIDGQPRNRIARFSSLSPTAAAVTIGGRVMTADGRGIRNVRVSLIEQNGTSRTVLSSAFGYYRFPDVTAGQTVILSASGKRFNFDNPTQILSVNDEMEEINFTASPQSRAN